MGLFIKVVAGVSFFLIWAGVVVMLAAMGKPPLPEPWASGFPVMVVLGAISLSLPVAMAYALGSIASDMKQTVRHLRVMRKYYEPDAVARRDA
jgi:hypothetical protein